MAGVIAGSVADVRDVGMVCERRTFVFDPLAAWVIAAERLKYSALSSFTRGQYFRTCPNRKQPVTHLRDVCFVRFSEHHSCTHILCSKTRWSCSAPRANTKFVGTIS